MQKYWPELFHFTLKLIPNRSDAEEVLQDASLVLWQKYEEFQKGSNFSGWAKSVISFEVMAFRKKKKKWLLFDDELVEELAATESERNCRILSIHAALDHCTMKLSEKDKNLVRLRYKERQSAKEIARIVERSADAIYKALGRIRLALHGCIQRELAKDARNE